MEEYIAESFPSYLLILFAPLFLFWLLRILFDYSEKKYKRNIEYIKEYITASENEVQKAPTINKTDWRHDAMTVHDVLSNPVTDTPEQSQDKTDRTNCVNCGGVLEGERRCKYCGTLNPVQRKCGGSGIRITPSGITFYYDDPSVNE